MHTRSAYIRRSRKVQRLKTRLAIVGMAGVVGCAALLLLVRSPGPVRTAMLDAVAATDAATVRTVAVPVAPAAQGARQQARRVYPYSVVPGGVSGGEDVKRMVRTDRVVAQHYAAFDADKARVLTVAAPRAVYVSYRKGDQVYWTKDRHTLAAGETVLSDGSSEIRGRCGNRISDTARLPVEARGPSEHELDTASTETQDPALQNVSFVPGADGGSGGGHQAFQLHNFGNGDAAQSGSAQAQAALRGGPGLGTPLDPRMLEMLLDGSRLLAANDGANGAPAGSGSGSGGSGSGSSGGSSGGSGSGTTVPVNATPADSSAPAKPGASGGAAGSGDTAAPATGSGNAGSGGTGTGNTGSGNTGTGNTGTVNPGTGNTGTGNPGTGNTGTGSTGNGNTGTGNTGNAGNGGAGTPATGGTQPTVPVTTPPTTQPNPGTTNPGTTNPGTTNPGTTNPGTTNPGTTNPGTTNPGTTNPGTTNPGTTNPGTNNPGTTNPGTTNPGTTNPGTTNPDIPIVLLPTEPIVIPPKPDNQGGKDSTDVPEPGTAWLSAVAFAALLLARRRRKA